MRATTAVLTALLFVPSLFAASSGPPSSSPGMSPRDPHAIAVEDFQSGQKRLSNVAKMNEELKTADAATAEKLQKKITKQLENAAADFKRSLKNESSVQGWSELGFTLRKLARYDESLKAYDTALQLVPNYGPAIEYRAEAYLGLNRLEEAKQAYTLLFSGNRDLADSLFVAMKKWADERKQNPNGVDPQQLDAFGKWIEQRSAVHSQTSALNSSPKIRTW